MINLRRSFQKHLNFFDYAIKGISTYRVRTVAIVCSLLVAIMILGAMTFLSDGLTRESSIAAAFAPDITVQGMTAGRISPVSLVDVQFITQLPEVQKVVPRSWGYVDYNGKIYTVMGIDPQNMPIPPDIDFIMSQGSFLQASQPYSAVVGKNLADSLGLNVNDVLVLQTESGSGNYSFQVSGIFETNVNLYTSDMVLVNINAAQGFFSGQTSSVTDVCVYLKDPSQANTVASVISSTNPMLRVLTKDAIKDATESTYGVRSGYVAIVWYVLLLAVILAAWNQLTTAGAEIKKEVGILKTLGFSTFDILEIRFMETLILGFAAATIGVFLAIIYDVYLGAPFLRDFLLGWSAVYPNFPLPINISPGSVMILFAVAVFPLFIGSLIPAWKSAVTEPDVAIRGG
jgi:ABC-type lipoprotein release transport system permease subunit